MKDENQMFDAYEKHLLKNGSVPNYGQATESQRVRDLKELKETLTTKEEKDGNKN